MTLRDQESSVRGLRLMAAYSQRKDDGLDEIASAIAEVRSDGDVPTATALFILLMDVLAAAEVLEIEHFMINDVDPGAFREAVTDRLASAADSLNRTEASFNATLQSAIREADARE